MCPLAAGQYSHVARSFGWRLGGQGGARGDAGGDTTGHILHPTVGLEGAGRFCYQICLAGNSPSIFPAGETPTTANWPQRPLTVAL
jgi:hypothetical protein